MINPVLLQLIFRCLLSFVGLFLVGTSEWSHYTFGEVSFEQLVYHTRFGLSGMLQTDTHSIQLFVELALLVPLATALLVSATSLFSEHRWKPAAEGPSGGLLHRARPVLRRLHLVAILGGLAVFLTTFSVGTYVGSLYGPDVFAAHYIEPAAVPLTATGKPKSLVLIYVESLEGTYQDRQRFGRDLLAPLTRLQQRYTHFDQYPQVGGAHWTIAGIVATQCGIPLKVALLPAPDDGRLHLRSFLPRATCLGDILHARGYENVFLNGPDLDFADVRTFLHDHGYDRSYGAREWVQAGEDPATMKEWGLRDDHLLARAKTELKQLMAAGRPFNLTILTVDTHGPDGLLSDECRHRGAKDFSSIVTCTAEQVAEFVNDIAAQGWLDRVSIVVQGDHIAMENPIHDALEASPQRNIFNLIVASPNELRLSDSIDHFDLFPTMLELVGLHPEAGRMGLGYCMLKRCGTPAPPPERFQQFKDGVLNRSPVYEALWTG